MLNRVSINFCNTFTVGESWEGSCNKLGVGGNFKDNPERNTKKKGDDGEGNKLAFDVVKACVVAILPNNISGFGCLFEVGLHSHNFFAFHRKFAEYYNSTVFILESYEHCCWSSQLIISF